MQDFSEKIQVNFNEQLGRHYAAVMDINIGETLLSESPLFVAPDWECTELKCSNCFEDSYIMCEKCNFFPLCMECREHDAFDCTFMQNQGSNISKQLLVRNCGIFAAIKLLLLMENPQTAMHCKPLLERKEAPFDNIESLSQMEMWQDHEELVVKPLVDANLSDCFSNLGQTLNGHFLHLLCLLIDAHAFEVNNKAGAPLKGVYVCGTSLPHNCIPNVTVALDDEHRLKLYASVPLQAGDILFNCYANPLMGTSQRQHQLRMTRLHNCACVRCLDPTELGTHLSSLKCAHCADGNTYCDLRGKGDWLCEKCGASRPATEVHALLAELGVAMVDAVGELEQYEELLRKYESKFHPNHFLLLDIKQNIASILRALMTSPLEAPSKSVLQRRVQISEQVLPVVRAVSPGISKLYAITLFEYLLALMELAELQFKGGEIPTECFKLKLQLAREIARKAMNMLAFEPTNSLEGHVIRRLEHEQRRIDEHLERLSVN